MKYSQLESMKKAVEVLSAYGQKTFANGKKLMKLQDAIRVIASTSAKTVVDDCLNHFRTHFATLPKTLRGEAKKRFCAACYDAINRKDSHLYFINLDGSTRVNAVLACIRKADDDELSRIIANFVDDDFSRFEAEKAAEKEAQYTEAMVELLEYDMSLYGLKSNFAA